MTAESVVDTGEARFARVAQHLGILFVENTNHTHNYFVMDDRFVV